MAIERKANENPDKIYLAFDHGFVAQSSTSKEDVNGNSIFLSEYKPIEYIRKNALLEWAEREMMKAAKQIDAYGRRNAFIDVIDKLNRM